MNKIDMLAFGIAAIHRADVLVLEAKGLSDKDTGYATFRVEFGIRDDEFLRRVEEIKNEIIKTI